MDAFTGEIRLLPYMFAPANWLPCDGRAVPIFQYNVLYALIGGIYGANISQQTFNLPDLRGYALTSANLSGNSSGLTPYTLNTPVGQASVTAPLPAHTHPMQGAYRNQSGDNNILPSPGNTVMVSRTSGQANFAETTTGTSVYMAPQMIAEQGNGIAHSNISPFLALQACICTDGIFPMRP
jgi:microcystin-dependent protein